MSKSPLHNIPMDWVRAFEAAGRLGNFTAAARETGLTQAAISQRIGKLEERIGSPLFDRKARGVDLTVAGEAWLPYVSDAFTALNISAQELFSTQRRQLTISASSSIINLWITPRLATLPSHEAIDFSFKTMILNPKSPVRSNELSILYGPDHWAHVLKAPLYEERISPIASPDLIRTSKNWESLPRITLTGPRLGWKDWISETGCSETSAPNLRFDSFSSALAAARSGLGVLLASLPLCQESIGNGELVRLSTETLSSESTYWILASENEISTTLWQALKNTFTE